MAKVTIGSNVPHSELFGLLVHAGTGILVDVVVTN